MRLPKSLAPKASDPITMVSAPDLRKPGHRVLADAAIGRQDDAPFGAPRRQQRARLLQARLGKRIEPLPFDADARAEQRQHADPVEEWARRGNRRVQLQHDA